MNDHADLIARLKCSPWLRVLLPVSGSGTEAYVSDRTPHEAADELERLRARVAELERVLSLALASLEESLDTVTHEYQTDWRHGMPTRAGQLAAMKQSLDAHHAAIAAARNTLEKP